MTGFTDISWMAVLLHVRNHGIMGTTKASENLYSDQTAVQFHLKTPSAHRYCTIQAPETNVKYSSYSYLGFLQPRNVSFAQRRSSCRQCGEVPHAGFIMQWSMLAVGTDVTRPTGPWKTARLPSLYPTSVIVIYLVPIPVWPCQFHLATQTVTQPTSLHHGFNNSPTQAPFEQSVRHEEGQRQGPTSDRSTSPSRPPDKHSKSPSSTFDKHSKHSAGLGSKPSTPSFDQHSNHYGSARLSIRQQQQQPFLKTSLPQQCHPRVPQQRGHGARREQWKYRRC
jgi:hypothetical protein